MLNRIGRCVSHKRTKDGVETMAQHMQQAKLMVRFDYAICAWRNADQLITLRFADDKEIVNQAMVKLQDHHYQQLQSGKSGDVTTDEAFKCRDTLAITPSTKRGPSR